MFVTVFTVSVKDGWIGLLTMELDQTDMLVGMDTLLMQYRSK